MIKVTIFNENVHEHEEVKGPIMKEIYPEGIHGVLKEILACHEVQVRIALMQDPECGLTEEVLENTDVLVWWAHCAHHLVPDEVSARVVQHVLCGMGFIALHSAMSSKPFMALMGTSCTIRYKHDDFERVFCCMPSHPIAEGVPENFELEVEETYGEFFDIPVPDELLYLGWFDSGEVIRAGCTWKRGYGKVFFFQPGHETNPSYLNPHVRRILQNAVRWAAPTARRKLSIEHQHVNPSLEMLRHGITEPTDH